MLEDPKPKALFLGFGDSSLNFELRVYSTNMDRYMDLRHDLHMAVDQAFRKAKVVVAFPQRDLHIRSVTDALPFASRDDKR